MNRVLGKKITVILGFLICATFFLINCSQYSFDPDARVLNSCESCHTDYALLQEVFSPDTAAAAGGCGGEAPHYEPYDRVFMGGEGYEADISSGHYRIGFAGCHNGDDKAKDKDI